MEQFERIKILLGKQKSEKIRNLKVIVFGLGGVGGYVCEALARSGVENFCIVDFDTVSVSNINRQIIATLNTVGQNKTDLVNQRILSINNNAKVQIVCQRIDETNIDMFDFSKFDYVVDAIDSTKSKLEIIKKAKAENCKVISCMGTGNKMDISALQICRIEKTHTCPLAKKMRTLLKQQHIDKVDVCFSTELPLAKGFEEGGKIVPASAIFVPATAGLLIANHIIKSL